MGSVNKACHLYLLSMSDYSQLHIVSIPNATRSENVFISRLFKFYQLPEIFTIARLKYFKLIMIVRVVSFMYQKSYYKL